MASLTGGETSGFQLDTGTGDFISQLLRSAKCTIAVGEALSHLYLLLGNFS